MKKIVGGGRCDYGGGRGIQRADDVGVGLGNRRMENYPVLSLNNNHMKCVKVMVWIVEDLEINLSIRGFGSPGIRVPVGTALQNHHYGHIPAHQKSD